MYPVLHPTEMSMSLTLLSEAYLYPGHFSAAKLVPLAYGIKKLQISCVVEDDKVCESLSRVFSQVDRVPLACVKKFSLLNC